MTSRIGEILASKYRLEEELGRGGMGAVYRAFHLQVHKQFAIKVLTTEVAGKRSLAARLVLEAQAAGRIGHPGILEVYDVGEDAEGRPFVVMELLRGETLAALVARGPVEPDVACWVAAQVLEILEAAHHAGVIHRDVKPQNVFLVAPSDDAPEGPRTVKLLDFGIAKFRMEEGTGITASGEIIGSPLYMAPEQARGEEEIDARADVWSVGAMLFEMLTGKPAHLAPSAISVLAKILTEVAPAPSSKVASVPPEVDAIVRKALVIDRSERFASASAMIADIEAARAARGWDAGPPSFASPSRRGAGQARAATAPVAHEGREHRTPSGSFEPAMESAVTAGAAGTTTTPRSRTTGIVVAVLMLVAGAVLPVVLLRRGDADTNASADAQANATAAANANTAENGHVAASANAHVAASANAPSDANAASNAVPAPASAPSAAASASVPVLSSGSPSAPASAPAPAPAAPAALAAPSAGPRRPTTGATPAETAPGVSKPACAPGEVSSLGHCCPAGHVWQSGHCERPLATSF